MIKLTIRILGMVILANWPITTHADEIRILDQFFTASTQYNYEFIQFLAKDWTKNLLTEKFQPPTNAAYILLPKKEENQLELVRTAYYADGALITVSQSSWMAAVQVDRPEWSEGNVLPLSAIKKEMEAIFKEGPQMEYAKQGQFEGTFTNRTRVEAPDLNVISYKQDKGRLVFVCDKDLGKRSSIFRSLGDEYWFTRKETHSLTPLMAINGLGGFVLRDGSSYYKFLAGEKFVSGPINSDWGRTMEGKWSHDGNTLTVVARVQTEPNVPAWASKKQTMRLVFQLPPFSFLSFTTMPGSPTPGLLSDNETFCDGPWFLEEMTYSNAW